MGSKNGLFCISGMNSIKNKRGDNFMLTIGDNTFSVAFSEDNGALQSISHKGSLLTLPGKELFTLGLRGQKGDLIECQSSEFRFHMEQSTQGFVFHFKEGEKRFPMLTVSITVTCENDGLSFRPRVDGIPEGFFFEWIELPQIQLSGSGKVLLPHFGGILLDDPLEQAHYSEPGWHYYSHYPGERHMQFMAYFSGGHGLYCATHDLAHCTKALICRPGENNTFTMAFRIYCGSGQPDFPLVLIPFSGDWMDACDIYREWVQKDPVLPPKGAMPQLVNESPVVLIYPVRGDGDDKGEMTPNEYSSYVNAMPVVRKLAEQFDSKTMPLLMHWEGTAPWAPPYVWPPYGGEDALAEFRDALHEEGHYLGVYCSGTAWTQTSSIIDYSREKQYAEEGLEKEMIRGPHGEIDAYICNGPTNQRIGYDMCISQERPREIVKAEVKKLADFGLDYVQFFDQNLGGASHMCWSREHNHPPVPGKWQTDNMASLMADLCASNPNLVLGCETAVADAYLRYLPFNDLRAGAWGSEYGACVPAYAYVFHEYINNFMGNQCGYTYWEIDEKKSPENLLYRTAFTFNSGDLLSVVLKDNGQIHWGWVVKWKHPSPEQTSIITLIRNLNAMRKKYPEFLRYGKMIKPLAKLTGGRWTLFTGTGNREQDAFLHSSWESPDGRKAQIVTNYLPQEQKIHVAALNGNIPFDITIPPLSAFVLSLEQLHDDSSIQRINAGGETQC